MAGLGKQPRSSSRGGSRSGSREREVPAFGPALQPGETFQQNILRQLQERDAAVDRVWRDHPGFRAQRKRDRIKKKQAEQAKMDRLRLAIQLAEPETHARNRAQVKNMCFFQKISKNKTISPPTQT